jgi:hypothetical protein
LSQTATQVRLPDGSRQPRRFALGDPVKAVYDFVDTLGSLACARYRYGSLALPFLSQGLCADHGKRERCERSLATSFPKRVYGADTHAMSIEEAGLKDAMLMVQPEDD